MNFSALVKSMNFLILLLYSWGATFLHSGKTGELVSVFILTSVLVSDLEEIKVLKFWR